MDPHDARYAYLHGFASGPASHKGVALRATFAARGLDLTLPDLNRPSFAQLTISAGLEAIDAWAAEDDAPIALIGSSLGGYTAALWAARNPARVSRLMLLCPGFELVARWPAILGAPAITRWRAHGALSFPDAEGASVPVHWGFIEDALTLPGTPSVPCPTLIVHGTQDETVPIASSRVYAAAHPELVRLVEVDDDHRLAASLPRIEAEVLGWFGLTG